MAEYYYDFHIHTCLSPCGDDDMTPHNIVMLASVLGLNIIAITDHNTTQNCAAAIEAAKEVGITVIPGMELSTAEDIHMVCLFPNLESAAAFEAEIRRTLPPIKNKPDIYGHQLVMDAADTVLREEEILLINATGISADDAPALCRSYGGVCYPAHIDRSSNSVLSVLGWIDASADFSHAEITHDRDISGLYQTSPILQQMPILRSSDAHRLEQMAETIHRALPLEENSAKALFEWLNQPKKQ